MCFAAKDRDNGKSREIDKALKQDAKRAPVKVLLLGTGESGKSLYLLFHVANDVGTFSKQLKLIHGGGFSGEEKSVYRRIVHQHLAYAIEQLKALMEESPDIKLQKDNQEALESFTDEVEITPDTAHKVKAM